MKAYLLTLPILGLLIVAGSQAQDDVAKERKALPSNPKMAATDALMRTLDQELATKELPVSFFPFAGLSDGKNAGGGRLCKPIAFCNPMRRSASQFGELPLQHEDENALPSGRPSVAPAGFSF